MCYVFGDYSLDTQRYELRRAGELIPLGPQVFNVLAYLVAQRDRVVSRDELFARLWPGQFVGEDALERCIRAARRALEDRPEVPGYIATSRGRGYRFIAPVQEQPHGLLENGTPTTVSTQSGPQPPSAAGREGTFPVSVPAASDELPGSSEAFPAPLLAGEYKQVTVLCGGLADALGLAGRLGPEAMHRRMQTAFTVVQAVLHRYAGSLIEFSGDGFVALFGAPVAQEDHAQRAVLAALALHVQLGASALGRRQASAEPLSLCVGLYTGRVVVDHLGGDPQRLYTAAGETTEGALRLRQLAAPGTTLLSAATQQLVQAYVRTEPWGKVQVGATQAPVPVYIVREIAQQRSGVVGHGARARSPFVGRARELALLQERLDAVMAGQGQVVGLVGEPGIGKSRLLAEFRRGLVGQAVRYVEGHCLSYGRATPYLPVADLVRQLCGMTPGEPYDTITAAVHRRLQEAALDPDEGVPLLLALLDIPLETERLATLSPPERKARTFALLRHLIFHEAQRHPCILAVENLHWSDATSEEWLTSLVERLAGTALLVLVTYRPGYQPPWLTLSHATQIALSPLRAGDSRTVVQAVLQTASVSATVVQEIVTQAAGNPFFLEELAWHVMEHRGGSPAPPAVPETIEAVLAARIDRLPPEEKRLLQTAAVIGMAVPVLLLQAVTDLAAAEIHAHLGYLQTAEFLYETGKLPAAAYTLKHALTHEVAYGSLLQERRRVLHAHIVKALEALARERVAEQVERLAHHALRGEVWAKAVTYCQQAGARAYDRAAFHEAVGAFEQALQALAHLPENSDTRGLALELRLALANPLSALGENERRLSLLGEAEALARALDDRARLGQVLARMAQALRLTGDCNGAIAAGQQALTLAAALGNSAVQGQASLNLGQACYAIGNFDRAAELLRRSVEAADKESGTPSAVLRIRSQAWLARTLSALGAFAEGRRYGEEALRLATLEGQGNTPIVAHSCLGHLYLDQGELENAIRVLEQGLALCRASGYGGGFLPAIAAGLGYTFALQGRLTEGRTLLEEAISESIRTGALQNCSLWVAWLSEVCRLAGRGEEAWQHARQALDLARQQKACADEAHALHQLGTVQAHADPVDAEQAEASYRQAMALAEELGMRPLQAHCHLAVGTLYAKTSRPELAHVELSAAIELYRAMDMTFWLPQAETALAHVV
jgi:DNA-binding winged helix-turn-helix (wHTH) protein/class 3 adenylate cyclase/tetratricopeptide (TPR) repeat protein